MKCLGEGASRLLVSSFATIALGCNAIFGISDGKLAGDGGGGSGGGSAQGGEAQGAGSSVGGASTGGSGTGGTGGVGGGPPAGCDPNGPTAVDASCGLFVSPTGDSNADGESPATATTFAKVLSNPPPNARIYVCGGPYLDNVVVPGGVTIEGGLDCTTWTRPASDATTIIQAINQAPALAVTGPSPTVLNNLNLVGYRVNASGGEMGSSIGAWFNNATVTVNASTIEGKEAGNGVDGTQASSAGASGNVGADGQGSATCLTTAALGGTSPCNTTGGAGAKCLASGSAGDSGLGNMGGFGQGGTGGGTCLPGGTGSTGEAGPNAMQGPDVGTLLDFNYIPALASLPAGPGAPGGGGGGGGTRTSAPSGGGGGGGGGCGGAGGTSGKGGGASFALVVTNSDVQLNGVRLIAGVAGRGGNGGSGQSGGQGGTGGSAGSGACFGGTGGQGGFGGNGAGGAGGPAAAIATTPGSSITPDAFTAANLVKGAAGVGGTGGNIGPIMGVTGQGGQKCARLVFLAGMNFTCDPAI